MPTTISQKFTETIPLVLGERNGDPVLMRTRAYYRGIPVNGEIWVTGDGIDEVVKQGFLEYVGESEGPRPDPTRSTIDEPAAPKDQERLARQKEQERLSLGEPERLVEGQADTLGGTPPSAKPEPAAKATKEARPAKKAVKKAAPAKKAAKKKAAKKKVV